MSPLHIDRILAWTLKGFAALAGCIVLLVVLFVAFESLPALREIGIRRFLTDSSWHPGSGQYNMTPMIVGTLAVAVGAVLLAAPTGIAAALFIRFYAPRNLGFLFAKLIELLAGIPSVVFGFWGLVVLVPIVSSSLLAGILILSLMILPTVSLVAHISLGKVQSDHIRGAAAVGLTRWGMISQVILPAARPGLVTGILLGAARAVGETMAVVMVCGNVVQLPGSLLDPVRTLTANIALEMAYATDSHRSVLFVSGLVLMSLVGILIVVAELSGRRRFHA